MFKGVGFGIDRVSTNKIVGGTTYDDLQVSISLAKFPAVNFPAWAEVTLDGVAVQLLGFSTNDHIQLFIQTNHSVDINTVIENHIHWTIEADDNGKEIQFQITGIAAGITESFASIGTIKSGDYVLANNAGKHNLLDIGNFPVVNTTVSSVFIVDLKRIAPDDGTDLAADVFVLFNDCHVRLNSFGSQVWNEKGFTDY